MHRSLSVRWATALVTASLTLAACGGDEPAEVAEDVAADVGDAAEEAADGMEDVAEEAEEALDDAGVDTEAEGSAEVEFMGTTYSMVAAERFGCFITEDGGSQGAVDFEGSDADGNEVQASWAGDSPDSSFLEFVAADGAEFQAPFESEVDVDVSGSSATLSGVVVGLDDPDQEQLPITVTASCG